MKTVILLLLASALVINAHANIWINSSPNDKLLSEYFSDNEIDDLSDLVAYFDSVITGNYPNDSESLSESYDTFFKGIRSVRNVGDMYNQYFTKFDQQKIFKCLDKDLMTKIWKIDYISTKCGKQDTILELRGEGAYMSFLKRSPILVKYCESIEIAGDISPASLSIFIPVQDKLNLNNISDRLIVAVHYLSLSVPLIARERH